MTAPFAPEPLMVSKLVSRKPSCLARISSNLSATSTSVRVTFSEATFTSSHAQNSARAAASLK
eukprot:Gb_05543 [translate_table: standard]